MDFRVHICASSDASPRRTGGPASRGRHTDSAHARTASEHTEVTLRTPGHRTPGSEQQVPVGGGGRGCGRVEDSPGTPESRMQGAVRPGAPSRFALERDRGREHTEASPGVPAASPRQLGHTRRRQGTAPAPHRARSARAALKSPHLRGLPGPVGVAGHPTKVSAQLPAPPAWGPCAHPGHKPVSFCAVAFASLGPRPAELPGGLGATQPLCSLQAPPPLPTSAARGRRAQLGTVGCWPKQCLFSNSRPWVALWTCH